MKYILLLSVISYSCIEIVDVDEAQKISNTLVVEGSITSELKRHQVELTKSHGTIGKTDPEPVTGADLSIYNGNGTVYKLREESPGIYLSDSIQGRVGDVYTLEISYENKIYEATDSMVASSAVAPIVLEPLNVSQSISGTQYFEFFYRDNFGSPQPYTYKITSEIAENVKDYYPADWQPADWLQIRLDESRLITTDSTYYLLPGLEPPAILAYGRTNDSRNLYGSVITERFYSMSPKYYAFIRAMLSETDWKTLGPFGYESANVPGNVSNGAFGFFHASDVYLVSQEIQQ